MLSLIYMNYFKIISIWCKDINKPEAEVKRAMLKTGM